MLPQASESHYKTQQRIAVAAARGVRSLWGRMGDDFDSSWSVLRGGVVGLLSEAQFAAATDGARYVPQVLAQTRQVDLPVGEVVPAAFAGTTASGLPLERVADNAVIRAKMRVASGSSVTEALKAGSLYLTMLVLSEVADAGRGAAAAGMTVRPSVSGYVRMLNVPSCKRCVILAGKWFRWNQGFQRHPSCDCRHIPSAEQSAGDYSTDPYAYFNSLSKEEQNKAFGFNDARAIRDGGDIYRVVNIRQSGLGTAKSAAKYGTPSRMTIDDIYKVAGHRSNAIKMMTEQGFITGPQVAGGNILGVREGFGALGRGGTRVGASAAVRDARFTGVRDPLNRYTMTAAERRLYDADQVMRTVEAGRNPWVKGHPLTAADRVLAERAFELQVRDLVNQPASVHELARRLGIIP